MIKTQSRSYDLEERTLKFAEAIIDLAKDLPKTIVNLRLIPQMIDAGTSIGANYREANAAFTRREFAHKISISRKEAKETEYWLKLILKANPNFKDRMDKMLQESVELIKIFSSIVEKSK